MVQHVSLQLSSVIVVVSLLAPQRQETVKDCLFYFWQDQANYNYLGTKSVLHWMGKLVVFAGKRVKTNSSPALLPQFHLWKLHLQ